MNIDDENIRNGVPQEIENVEQVSTKRVKIKAKDYVLQCTKGGD